MSREIDPEKFFSNTTHAKPPEPATPTTTPTPNASATAPAASAVASPVEPPATKAIPTDEEIADRLFSSPESLRSTYGPSFKHAIDALADRTGMSQAQRTAHLDLMAETFASARIPSDPASGLHSLIVHHLQEPPDEKTVAQWSTDSRKQLRERFGADGDRRLQAAMQFIEARPELRSLLERTSLGSHPRFVLALCERVHQLRVTPRKP